MASGGTGMWALLGERLRLFLASRWRRCGDPWELRMRAAGRRAESDMRRDPAERFYAALCLDRIVRSLPAGIGSARRQRPVAALKSLRTQLTG